MKKGRAWKWGVGLLGIALIGAVSADLLRGAMYGEVREPDPETKRQADAIFQRTNGDLSSLNDADWEVVQSYIVTGGKKPPNFKLVAIRPKETRRARMRRMYLNSWGRPRNVRPEDVAYPAADEYPGAKGGLKGPQPTESGKTP